MAIAGRVAIVPKGEWVETTPYQKLDLVTHNRNAYIAKKPSTGVVPEDGEIWMLVLENYLQADVDTLSAEISAIISGTTQVGNAETLDGHGAEYFTPLADLSNYVTKIGAEVDSRVDAINANGDAYLVAQGARGIIGVGDSNDGTKRQISIEPYSAKPNDKEGTLLQCYDGTNWNVYYMLHSGNFSDYALPLKGGTVESSSVIPFGLKHLGEYGQYIAFSNNLGKLGHLGIDANKKPYFKNAENTVNYEIFHTGNKPSGTYTGNGSAMSRTINTGGIGNAVVISSETGGNAIVFEYGVIYAYGSSVTATSKSIAYFKNGIFTVSSADTLNKSGLTYTYQVL